MHAYHHQLPRHFVAIFDTIKLPISLELYPVWLKRKNLAFLLFFVLISLLAPRSKG
uniref:Dof zinc finger protein DOF1.1-like n=1 Tax=Rhizophora mucronata TaxID=61149 RepID=A0A2P2NHZ4_RHIMU